MGCDEVLRNATIFAIKLPIMMACLYVEKPEFIAKSKILKKGTLSEALLVDARNKILIAFDCRQIKNSFGGNIT